jgi:hypothetical protein
MKTTLIIVLVALLGSVVVYLAMDRQDKNVAQQRDKSFDTKFAR